MGMVVSFQGLLMPFSYQLPVLFERVGVKRVRSAALAHRFYDGLAEALEINFILILYLNRKTQLILASLLRLLSQPDVQTLSLR